MAISDADIMRRVQTGEVNLFGLLVSRYRSRLLQFAVSKLGDRAAAEDAVQEAFLAAYQARDAYNPHFAFSTWLWTILINHCRRLWRRGQKRATSPLESAEAQASDRGAGGLQRLIDAEQQTQLGRWLAQLPEADADAVRLRFFGELTYDEIACAMQSSVSGAKKRVRRGLERLAEMARSDEAEVASKPQAETHLPADWELGEE